MHAKQKQAVQAHIPVVCAIASIACMHSTATHVLLHCSMPCISMHAMLSIAAMCYAHACMLKQHMMHRLLLLRMHVMATSGHTLLLRKHKLKASISMLLSYAS